MVRAARLETQRAPAKPWSAATSTPRPAWSWTTYEATSTALTVRVKTEGSSKYRIRFIGRGGQVLQEATEPTATYTFTGDEGYVRAKVLESNGRVAWVQPVQVARKNGARGAGLWTAVAAMGAFVLARRQGRTCTDAK